MIKLTVNGQRHTLDLDPSTPLLWALRDGLKLNGTKYSCGIAQCGSCTVLVDGKPVRSCVTPISTLTNKKITTIEGLSKDQSHPVQQAWLSEQVVQCGYCQSAQILTAAALLESKPNPGDADIDEAFKGVLCRCGTYPRVRKAVKIAASLKRKKASINSGPARSTTGEA